MDSERKKEEGRPYYLAGKTREEKAKSMGK